MGEGVKKEEVKNEAEKIIDDKRKKFVEKQQKALNEAFQQFLDQWVNKMSEVERAKFVFNLHVGLSDLTAVVNSFVIEKAKETEKPKIVLAK